MNARKRSVGYPEVISCDNEDRLRVFDEMLAVKRQRTANPIAVSAGGLSRSTIKMEASAKWICCDSGTLLSSSKLAEVARFF